MQICYSVFLIINAISDNRLKVFYRFQKIHQNPIMQQNSLSVQGDCGGFRVILLIHSRPRIRPECFAVHGEYTDRQFSSKTKKNQILNHLLRYDQIGKNYHTLLSLQISFMKKFPKKETDVSALLQFLISFGERLCPIIGHGELSTARLRPRYRYYKHFFHFWDSP